MRVELNVSISSSFPAHRGRRPLFGARMRDELDDALGLTDMVGDELVDPRTGKNGQHALTVP